ncbi:ParA family protein [Vibrio sp. D431a]|uniref:ParA family protein n=1 Tax=Vibrio sp. D431a TaxID=2837388 RepID=UPI0025522829|nr:ParA family protein [Vibrio sp. D431a]MDK9790089.1 ParA family protein [Vibrio sp. D431a]
MVDLSGVVNRFDETRQSDDDMYNGEIHQFRKYTRAEAAPALGAAGTNGFTRVENLIQKYYEAEYGEELLIGEKNILSDKYVYSLEEIYKLQDLIKEFKDKYPKLQPNYDKLPKPFNKNNSAPAIISVANQKGGVGKTTTVVHLGAQFSIKDFKRTRTLIIDLDPQGGVHSFCDGRQVSMFQEYSLPKYLMGDYEHLIKSNEERVTFLKENIIRQSKIPNMHYTIAFSDDNRLDASLNVMNTNPVEDTFDRLAEKYGLMNVYSILSEEFIELIKDDYDVIIIDTAPVNSIVTHSAIYASDHLVVPCPPHRMDFDSTDDFIHSVEECYRDKFPLINPEKKLKSLHAFMIKSRSSDMTEEVAARLRYVFGDYFHTHTVSDKVAYRHLTDEYKTVFELDSSSNENKAYQVKETLLLEWGSVFERILTSVKEQWEGRL